MALSMRSRVTVIPATAVPKTCPDRVMLSLKLPTRLLAFSETAGRVESHASECRTCAGAIDDLRGWAGSEARVIALPATTRATTPAREAVAASRMRWYALAASIVMALTLPLGYWWQSTHGEPPGLRGLASLAPDAQARVRKALQDENVPLPADVATLAGQPEVLMGSAI